MLAERMTKEFGHPVHRATLAKIESGGTRAENVTVKDLFAIAAALNVAPIYLITPADESTRLMVTPETPVPAGLARGWMQGGNVLRRGTDDEAEYYTTKPPAEMEALIQLAKVVRAEREGTLPADVVELLGTPGLPLDAHYAEQEATEEVAAEEDEGEASQPERSIERHPKQGAFAWQEDGQGASP